MMEGD